jgi:hypothetical protein
LPDSSAFRFADCIVFGRCIVAAARHARLRLGSMDRLGMRGGREMADIAAESNGYTRPRHETRNNVTSEFGDSPV